MEYQVPQFIEAEDKIVGPLTFRQFLYLGGAAGLCVICFMTLNILLALLLSIPIIAFAAALSFYTVNGKPFVQILEAGFNYLTGAKLFLWRQHEPKPEANVSATVDVVPTQNRTPRLTSGKLSELAWSLDIAENKPE